MGEVVARGDGQRPVKRQRGPRHRAEAIECGAVAHPGVGIVRPQPQAGLERGDRAAPVAAGDQRAAEGEVGVGRFRLGRDGGARGARGLCRIALVEPYDGEIDQRRGLAGHEVNTRQEQFSSLGQGAGRVLADTQVQR